MLSEAPQEMGQGREQKVFTPMTGGPSALGCVAGTHLCNNPAILKTQI